MINLNILKQGRPANVDVLNDNRRQRQPPAYLRIVQESADIASLPSTCEVKYPNEDDLLNFIVIIKPNHGFYDGGQFIFSIAVPSEYPHEAPSVKCKQIIYHPNIDLNGNVCLNILREDWNPVLTISAVILGIMFLFSAPNSDDPLNKEAAKIQESDINKFQKNVSETMAGGTLDKIKYDNVLIK